MLNSLYYVTIMIGLGLIVNSIVRFCSCKASIQGRDFLFSLIVALIIIPLESIILPLYFMIFEVQDAEHFFCTYSAVYGQLLQYLSVSSVFRGYSGFTSGGSIY